MNLTPTESIIIDKYGINLSIPELAELLKVTPAHIRNMISNETFNLPTYTIGRKRLADFRDVARYIDNVRSA